MRSVNPATGETVRAYEDLTPAAAAKKIEACERAFPAWSARSFAERGAVLRAAASVLRRRRDELAATVTTEMGKTIRESRAEVEKCALGCDYYAERAEEMLADEPVATDAARSAVIYRPLGVILAVMPWNFPFWQAFRAAAPALMAGNTVALKHASNVPGSALAIESVLREAGLPDGAFAALLVGSGAVPALIHHPAVRAVTLTGSAAAGRAVAAEAARALKKTVLELGGSDAYLVLEDADLDLAARTCVAARMANCGQSCISAKRLIAVDPVYGEFERRVAEEIEKVRTGDPVDESVTMGPLARRDLREELHGQVQRSVQAGASCIAGGKVPAGPGSYYPPTVLTGVRRGMPAFDEEIFGPVACLIRAAGEEDAIRIANDCEYGLGAAVFTRDTARGERIAADRLEAGCCFVNAMVRSDPRLPFGGIKASGYGRELARHGIRELVNTKTVYVA